jgi:hypothetical protein
MNMRLLAIILVYTCCALAGGTALGEELLIDPTRPSTDHGISELRPRGGTRELQLEGILQRDARRIAIIDGRVLHEGDRIGNATIMEITPDAVRYSRDGHDHTLWLARNTWAVRRLSSSP